MIDRRKNKDAGSCETDLGLAEVSDHDVLMTFREALSLITPSLVKIRAHVGDPWDDVAEGLYYSMVHLTFAGKYGIPADRTAIHKYGFTQHCYRRIFHVECVPREYPLPMWIGGERRQLGEDELVDRFIVFKAFVDSNGTDPSFEEPDVTDTPDFKLVAVDIVDVSSGLRFRKFKDVDLYLSPDDVSFEWAAEEYDAEEHKFHRPIFFEDIG